MDETYAYFAVVGSGNYAAITQRLGISPSRAWSEGDPRPNGGAYPATKWFLESGLERSQSFEKHLEVLLPTLEGRADAVKHLAPDYEAFIQCVGYFDEPSPGFHLNAPTIARIAALGLSVDFDLYSRASEKNGEPAARADNDYDL